MPFVASKMGIPVTEDVIQDGYIGLWKAALHYDRNRRIRFSTYAAAAIKNSIIREWRNQSKSIITEISLNQPAYREGEGDIRELLEIIPGEETERSYRELEFGIFLDEVLTAEEQRIAIMRSNGVTLRRIGDEFGRSDSWVIDRLFRIQKKLKRHYGKED